MSQIKKLNWESVLSQLDTRNPPRAENGQGEGRDLDSTVEGLLNKRGRIGEDQLSEGEPRRSNLQAGRGKPKFAPNFQLEHARKLRREKSDRIVSSNKKLSKFVRDSSESSSDPEPRSQSDCDSDVATQTSTTPRLKEQDWHREESRLASELGRETETTLAEATASSNFSYKSSLNRPSFEPKKPFVVVKQDSTTHGYLVPSQKYSAQGCRQRFQASISHTQKLEIEKQEKARKELLETDFDTILKDLPKQENFRVAPKRTELYQSPDTSNILFQLGNICQSEAEQTF